MPPLPPLAAQPWVSCLGRCPHIFIKKYLWFVCRPEGRLRAADLAGGHHYLYTPLLEPEQHAGLAVGSAAHGWEQGQRQQGQQGQQAGQAAAAAAAAAGEGHPGARLPLLPLALLQDLPGNVRDTLRRREAAMYQASPAAMLASFQALLEDATAALLKAAGDSAASQQTAVSQQALLDQVSALSVVERLASRPHLLSFAGAWQSSWITWVLARLSDAFASLPPPLLQQSLNAPPQHAQQQPLGKGKQATAANVPAGHASTSPPHAAIMLRGVFGLGLEPGQTEPYVQDGMLNGVRFGLVAGRQRLLAAEQVDPRCRGAGACLGLLGPFHSAAARPRAGGTQESAQRLGDSGCFPFCVRPLGLPTSWTD